METAWFEVEPQHTARHAMLSKEQARSLVTADLNDDAVDVLDQYTIEREWGWVFFFQSKRFIQTRDWRDGLIGNAPYLVNRRTGAFGPTGTSATATELIEAYELLLSAQQ
jgi:hypothetical protein